MRSDEDALQFKEAEKSRWVLVTACDLMWLFFVECFHLLHGIPCFPAQFTSQSQVKFRRSYRSCRHGELHNDGEQVDPTSDPIERVDIAASLRIDC